MPAENTWEKVLEEVKQGYTLRQPLLKSIGKFFEDRYIVFLVTGRLDTTDVEMVKTVLGGSKTAKEKKILFMIYSPGGDPLAAERMIKILSEFSDNDYWALVPSTAKSAATMICLGASKIIMGPVSELGPIDLQIEKDNILIPAYSIVTAYDNLMQQGINLKKNQRIEPILQQLQGFDPAEIEHYREVNELASDMASKALKSCMLSKKPKKEIDKLIKLFTDPKRSKVHGRPIYYSDIKEFDKDGCFKLELIDTNSDIWKKILEYQIRVEAHLDANNASKLIESCETSYIAGGK